MGDDVGDRERDASEREKKTAAFLAEPAARRFFWEGSVLFRQLISSERAAANPSPTTQGVATMSPKAGRWMNGFMSAPEPVWLAHPPTRASRRG